MLTKTRILIVLLGVTLVLSACGGQNQVDPTATQNPEAVFTAAAQTADAKMAENAARTPTATSAPPTETKLPPSPTSVPGTPTQTPPPTPEGGGLDLIEFILDVTVPDGANYSPGDSFTKTWRLKNIGNTTWSTAYALVFISDAQMGAPSSVPLSENVLPGEMVDVSVNLVAPDSEGTYIGYWMLRNAAGRNFGLGPNADGTFYVMINVVGPVSGGAGTATPTTGPGTPTATVTGNTGETVSGVSLSVDNAVVEGACPHSFNFIAQFTLNQATTVTYQLEADTGFDITLPAPTTVQLDAGNHEVNYTLEFSDDVSGWAQFHVSSPQNVVSQQVTFELNCQ